MNDKEKKAEANRKYYEKNKDRLAEKWKNDPIRKEKQREYYLNNRERILKRNKEWNIENEGPMRLIRIRYAYGNKLKQNYAWRVRNE